MRHHKNIQLVPGALCVGYGFALTNQSWYDDVLRVEYRQCRGVVTTERLAGERPLR